MKDCGADCIVSLGGGSTTGLGKRALRTGVNQLCNLCRLEMTPILGETKDGLKRPCAPTTCCRKPSSTTSTHALAAAALAATSGINAIAHAQ
jgi:alcohol dehydrogenase class IV